MTATATKFEPLHEVTMYQARCTNCGTIEDDYGDFSAWSDSGTPIEQVCDNGWFSRWSYVPNPTPDTPRGRIGTLEELLCENCQHCEVCGGKRAYEIEDHLVCADHEGHNFTQENE